MAQKKLSMRAKLPDVETSNARNYGDDKETIAERKIVARIGGKLRIVCDARFYMGRSSSASVVYCALWVHGKDKWFSGKGSAGGYGYHKQSAALEEAIRSAGIEVYGANYAHSDSREAPNFKNRAHIGGCGDSSMDEALLAIARAIGADITEDKYLIVS